MVSEHFKRSEFACKDQCGFEAVDVELINILEKVRKNFGSIAINITNACRCLEHNKDVGSKDTSQHIKGMAVDFWIKGINPESIAMYLEQLLPDRGGIGIYDDFVHCDVRSTRARWNNRSK